MRNTVTIPALQMRNTLLRTLGLLGLTAAPILAVANPALANTEVPITRISINTAAGDFTHRTINFVVPNSDTTLSAYGGKLRLYDVHIAKMVEVTYNQFCVDESPYAGVYWNYRAGNGDIDMGQFYVSCELAKDLVAGYGLGHPERTVLTIQPSGRDETVAIPVLSLTPNKIPKFMDWVSRFKPQ
jgi:hypothetical protein